MAKPLAKQSGSRRSQQLALHNEVKSSLNEESEIFKTKLNKKPEEKQDEKKEKEETLSDESSDHKAKRLMQDLYRQFPTLDTSIANVFALWQAVCKKKFKPVHPTELILYDTEDGKMYPTTDIPSNLEDTTIALANAPIIDLESGEKRRDAKERAMYLHGGKFIILLQEYLSKFHPSFHQKSLQWIRDHVNMDKSVDYDIGMFLDISKELDEPGDTSDNRPHLVDISEGRFMRDEKDYTQPDLVKIAKRLALRLKKVFDTESSPQDREMWKRAFPKYEIEPKSALLSTMTADQRFSVRVERGNEDSFGKIIIMVLAMVDSETNALLMEACINVSELSTVGAMAKGIGVYMNGAYAPPEMISIPVRHSPMWCESLVESVVISIGISHTGATWRGLGRFLDKLENDDNRKDWLIYKGRNQVDQEATCRKHPELLVEFWNGFFKYTKKVQALKKENKKLSEEEDMKFAYYRIMQMSDWDKSKARKSSVRYFRELYLYSIFHEALKRLASIKKQEKTLAARLLYHSSYREKKGEKKQDSDKKYTGLTRVLKHVQAQYDKFFLTLGLNVRDEEQYQMVLDQISSWRKICADALENVDEYTDIIMLWAK